MSGAQGGSVIRDIASENGRLLREDQSTVVRGNEIKLVSVPAEVEFCAKPQCFLRAEKKAAIGSALDSDGRLKSLLNQLSEEAKETDEIALALNLLLRSRA